MENMEQKKKNLRGTNIFYGKFIRNSGKTL